MNNAKTVTIPCTSVRIDPATGKFITNRNSSITLKVVGNKDGSASCEIVRKADQTQERGYNPSMNNEKIKKVNDLLGSNVGNRIINVTFRKKSGELRSMLLKKDPELEATVKGTRPEATAKAAETLKSNGMRRVEEMTPDGTSQFRTLNLNTVTQITVNGVVHTFED